MTRRIAPSTTSTIDGRTLRIVSTLHGTPTMPRPFRYGPAVIAERSAGRAFVAPLRSAAIIAVGSGVIALGAQVAIPLPFSPVPVTGQTLGVLAVAGALGLRLGTLSVCLYVIEGLIGLPVFAGGASGAARLIGPTGGYIVGFVAAAAVVGALMDRGWRSPLWKCGLAMVMGEVVLYSAGLLWLGRFPMPTGLLEAGFLPFLVGDAYKVVVATVATATGQHLAHRLTRV